MTLNNVNAVLLCSGHGSIPGESDREVDFDCESESERCDFECESERCDLEWDTLSDSDLCDLERDSDL